MATHPWMQNRSMASTNTSSALNYVQKGCTTRVGVASIGSTRQTDPALAMRVMEDRSDWSAPIGLRSASVPLDKRCGKQASVVAQRTCLCLGGAWGACVDGGVAEARRAIRGIRGARGIMWIMGIIRIKLDLDLSNVGEGTRHLVQIGARTSELRGDQTGHGDDVLVIRGVNIIGCTQHRFPRSPKSRLLEHTGSPHTL